MNILLTSVGRRTYMVEYFKVALKGIGKVFAANSMTTYSLMQADNYVITPNIYDSKYIEFIINYCLDNKIKAIIPLFDIDLPILSKNKLLFSKYGIKVIVSDEEIIKICNDKWKTYEFLKSNELNHPISFLSIEDFKMSINKKISSYPVIIKPRWGMGSIGIYEANNELELDILYNKTKDHIFNTYLKYESKEDINRCVIIQQKITGEEFGLDIFNDFKKNYVTTIPKRKISMRAGETDVAEIIKDNRLILLGKFLSEKTNHIGNLDVDCFIKNNTVYVLEMNCRFGGQYPFSHIAGANFIQQIVNWLMDKETDISLINVNFGTVGCKDLSPVIFNYVSKKNNVQ